MERFNLALSISPDYLDDAAVFDFDFDKPPRESSSCAKGLFGLRNLGHCGVLLEHGLRLSSFGVLG